MFACYHLQCVVKQIAIAVAMIYICLLLLLHFALFLHPYCISLCPFLGKQLGTPYSIHYPRNRLILCQKLALHVLHSNSILSLHIVLE